MSAGRADLTGAVIACPLVNRLVPTSWCHYGKVHILQTDTRHNQEVRNKSLVSAGKDATDRADKHALPVVALE